MEIVQKPVSEIIPYERNPRVNDGAVAALVASIREFGFRQPIVVDADMVIVVGHTRFKAAIQLGLKTVPVHIARDLTPAQLKAYRIADNQTATIAEWDFDLLPLELGELETLEFDLNLLGFGVDELAKIRGTEEKAGETDPNEIPEPPQVAITQPGDLWVLGEHRLLCGDSTNLEDVLRLMAGEKAALASTDPPYLVDYTGERPNHSGKDWSASYREIDITDADAFFRAVFTNILQVLAPHSALFAGTRTNDRP